MTCVDFNPTRSNKVQPAGATAEVLLEALELLSWPPSGEDDCSHSAMAWRERHNALLHRVSSEIPGLLGAPVADQRRHPAPAADSSWIENLPLESVVSVAVCMLTAEHDSPGWEFRCAQMLAAALNRRAKQSGQETLS